MASKGNKLMIRMKLVDPHPGPSRKFPSVKINRISFVTHADQEDHEDHADQ